MAIINSIFNTFILLLTISHLSVCLYEDQIGKFDWKKSYLGKIKYANFDSIKRIIVASEENVIAALNLKNGQIVWRQLLENPQTHQIELLHVENEAVTVSGDGNVYYIRGWDLALGTLIFEWSMFTEKSNGRWIISKDQIIHVVPVIHSHLEVTYYQKQTGLNKGTTLRISTPWVSDLSKCVLADTFFNCLSNDNSNGTIYSINLEETLDTHVQTKSISSLLGDAPGTILIKEIQYSEPAILLVRNDVSRLVTIGTSVQVLPYSLALNIIYVPNGAQNMLFSFESMQNNPNRSIKLKTIDTENGSENVISLETPYNTANPTLIAGICRGTNCRVLFTTEDYAVSLLQLPSGKVQWSREEALSQVVAAEFVELPLSELDASIEREFTEASNNDVLSMFLRRLLSQAKQLSSFINGQPMSINNNLVRDDFGLHKIIILATRVGKLFALDTLSGDIVWSHYLRDIAPFNFIDKESMILFEQRTSRYSPLSAEITLLAKDSMSGEGVLFKFDPITGKSIGGITKLYYKIKQAMLMPFEDKTHVKAIIILSENNDVYVYPSEAKIILSEHASTTYLFNADVDNSRLNGYTLFYGTEDAPKATSTWNLNLAGSKIVALSMRPSMERVHSQGRVLADRSVFYKYVNPNLIAVATLADDAMHKHVLSLYLVDGITGLVVYSAHHKRATGPVHIIHSENWVVYSYFSERFRRYEVTAVELYEGARQSNSSDFSSHALSQLPHPETLSYILPANPVAMVATLTERGITNKHVLIGLSNGAVIELPWAFLEPRGPHLASNPEEGYIPYMPELPLLPEATINYNQSLGRIKGIQVSPAKLESTSLVIVYGLDLFYTRVTPSKTFDVLKEDFDHWLIVMVLLGLTFASYVTKQLSVRKALKQMWK